MPNFLADGRFEVRSINSSELSANCFKILQSPHTVDNPTDNVDGQGKHPEQHEDMESVQYHRLSNDQYAKPANPREIAKDLTKQVQAGKFPKIDLLCKEVGCVIYSIDDEACI